jgi:hypothetical protein
MAMNRTNRGVPGTEERRPSGKPRLPELGHRSSRVSVSRVIRGACVTGGRVLGLLSTGWGRAILAPARAKGFMDFPEDLMQGVIVEYAIEGMGRRWTSSAMRSRTDSTTPWAGSTSATAMVSTAIKVMEEDLAGTEFGDYSAIQPEGDAWQGQPNRRGPGTKDRRRERAVIECSAGATARESCAGSAEAELSGAR